MINNSEDRINDLYLKLSQTRREVSLLRYLLIGMTCILLMGYRSKSLECNSMSVFNSQGKAIFSVESDTAGHPSLSIFDYKGQKVLQYHQTRDFFSVGMEHVPTYSLDFLDRKKRPALRFAISGLGEPIVLMNNFDENFQIGIAAMDAAQRIFFSKDNHSIGQIFSEDGRLKIK